MTHEQRAKSIADLVQFHENLIAPQRTISLPNFNEQLTKLDSVTSLVSERTKANMMLIENDKLIERSSQQKTNANDDDDQSQSPVVDLKNTSSPIKLISLSRTNSPSTIIYPLMTNSYPSIQALLRSHSSNSIITPVTSQKPSNNDNSLNDVTDKLSQISSVGYEKSIEIDLNLFIKHSQAKPVLTVIDDGDTSMVTRLTTASTNLTADNDGEQSKRNSLDLVRDSLDLLRHASPHEPSIDEQLHPDRTPYHRKSVLKSHLDSSDHFPTSDFISYIAIDDLKGDKQLVEQQVRYDKKEKKNFN